MGSSPGTEKCALLQYTVTSCVWSSVFMVSGTASALDW